MSDTSIKILLVDDDEDDYVITRELISLIKDVNYKLEWISNYDTALATIQRHEHAICLLDYRLGERTGLELLRESQSFSNRPPMILLTGQGDHEIDLEAMKAGAVDYLIKGQFNADKLERAIRYAIQGKRAEDNLRRERDLISRIMETSPVGIVVTCRLGKIIFANNRAEEILNLTKEAIAKGERSVLDWCVTDPEGHPLPDLPVPLKQVLDSGQPVEDICHAVERANKSRALLSTNATPLFDAAGHVDGMVVTIEDITQRLVLEAKLRQSQKMESVGQLAAGVAHDINNILTVIHGHTGLLLTTVQPDTDTEKSLKQIAAASERAASFIRQLLMFSRKQVFQTKILDLNAVIQNLHNMLPRLIGEHITLDIKSHPDMPRVKADTGMMEQLVMNLAVNSRDAMPKGGKLTIETSGAVIETANVREHPEGRVGRFVCLTVADTGCGMERSVLQRIFEPFFTTKEVGKGTGLGLATVYGIVKNHQGWIEVQSEVGKGTTFKVFLPASEKTGELPTETNLQPQTARGGEETILLVEDEPGLLELAKKVLLKYQYRILTATSGADALRIWKEQSGKIDLLLTDMIMPGGMTGSDLSAELKKQNPALRVIFTSGYSAELVGKDFGHTETTFLAKPYLPLQLAHAVRKCLDSSAKNRQAAAATAPVLAA